MAKADVPKSPRPESYLYSALFLRKYWTVSLAFSRSVKKKAGTAITGRDHIGIGTIVYMQYSPQAY